MKFGHLKIGDRVDRMIGEGKFFMEMEVVEVREDVVVCTAIDNGTPIKSIPVDELWQFDRLTGVEEDHELGWGRRFGVTGTYLSEKPKVN